MHSQSDTRHYNGEAPERWSWGSPVQDFPPNNHFGLGHLERGLRTLGFLSREAV